MYVYVYSKPTTHNIVCIYPWYFNLYVHPIYPYIAHRYEMQTPTMCCRYTISYSRWGIVPEIKVYSNTPYMEFGNWNRSSICGFSQTFSIKIHGVLWQTRFWPRGLRFPFDHFTITHVVRWKLLSIRSHTAHSWNVHEVSFRSLHQVGCDIGASDKSSLQFTRFHVC